MGVDEQGRSCVVSEREMIFGPALPGLSISGLYRTTESPPPPRPEGKGELMDLGVLPGGCLFALHRFEPDSEIAVHHTETIDFDTVVSGLCGVDPRGRISPAHGRRLHHRDGDRSWMACRRRRLRIQCRQPWQPAPHLVSRTGPRWSHLQPWSETRGPTPWRAGSIGNRETHD